MRRRRNRTWERAKSAAVGWFKRAAQSAATVLTPDGLFCRPLAAAAEKRGGEGHCRQRPVEAHGAKWHKEKRVIHRGRRRFDASPTNGVNDAHSKLPFKDNRVYFDPKPPYWVNILNTVLGKTWETNGPWKDIFKPSKVSLSRRICFWKVGTQQSTKLLSCWTRLADT